MSKNRSGRRLLLAAALLLGFPAIAQDRAETEAAVRQYPNENAIIWNQTEHLTLRFEEGKLTASGETSRKVLLLNDMAAGFYNTGYVYHSFFHKLLDVEGASLVPSGDGFKTVKATDYKTTRSEDNSIFYDDAKQTKITFTNLVKGALTQTQYDLYHKDIHFLPPFYFQYHLPVRKATFRVTVPHGVELRSVVYGQMKDKVRQSVEEDKKTTTYTWTVSDMPKAETYDDAPSPAYFVTHMIVYVASYKDPETGTVVPVLGNASDLYRFYYPFIRDINRSTNDSVKQLVSTLTKDATTQRQKAERIYKWVQQNIRYVAFEDGMGGYIPREAGLVFHRRYGDCKDLSSLLVTMYRAAGLQAYFTWIGTRDIPYTYDNTPLPLTDNHMICALKLDNDWVFADGTDPLIAFGVPPYALQGKEALIGIDADNYKVVRIPEADARQNSVLDSTRLSIAGDALQGAVQIDVTGYGAWTLGGTLHYNSAADKEKTLRSLASRGSNKYVQKEYDYQFKGKDDSHFSMRSTFELKDYLRNIGKEYYVNLNLQRLYQNDFADKDGRKVMIERDYRSKTKQVVVLDVPKGYKVSYLPPDKADKVPGLWGYRISYRNTGKQVTLLKEFEFDATAIRPEQFDQHNRLVQELRNQYKESIILTAE